MKKRKNAEKDGQRMVRVLAGLIFLEVAVFVFLLLTMVVPYTESAFAGVGEDNVTVITLLQVGNVFPEIINVTVTGAGLGLDLSPNTTTTVIVNVTARDYNGEGDIANITSVFFDMVSSTYGAGDDNNDHYTNNTCTIDYSYGDPYEVNALCTFDVWYYANNASWNASVLVTDNQSLTGSGSSLVTVNALLALLLPDTLDYGQVNATDVSDESQVNVTNVGNAPINLSLSGYAVTEGDGLAMNCTLGTIQNISIQYEKYNLTSSNSGPMDLSGFEANYTNLTSASVINRFDLPQRLNDTDQFVDDTNNTYWRIYVPVGVAGTCTGNIIFGAVQSSAS